MRADYIMIGGFLGAVKTTAVLALARELMGAGRRVGLITNDQSIGLVDTALATVNGFPVEEITGGCFCCRFTSLTEAATRLDERARPEAFIAEPVGSCTDLRATVSYPLKRLYGDAYRVAPLSVLVDPVRALRLFGVEGGRSFTPRVRYVYEKQLEEADLVVINKIDLLEDARLARLRAELEARFPQAHVLAVSARTGLGMHEWFSRVLGTDLGLQASPDVDYDIYADGEARLGWFNGTVAASADDPFDGNALLHAIAAAVQQRLAAEDIEIAHYKMTLAPEGFGHDLGAINVVRTDTAAELSHRLSDPITAGKLLVNLRAEASPDTLRAAVAAALSDIGHAGPLRLRLVHAEAFSPARPTPTHRMATV
jgi:G3E family GTPase